MSDSSLLLPTPRTCSSRGSRFGATPRALLLPDPPRWGAPARPGAHGRGLPPDPRPAHASRWRQDLLPARSPAQLRRRSPRRRPGITAGRAGRPGGRGATAPRRRGVERADRVRGGCRRYIALNRDRAVRPLGQLDSRGHGVTCHHQTRPAVPKSRPSGNEACLSSSDRSSDATSCALAPV